MCRSLIILCSLVAVTLLTSCEDLIDLNLNDSEPRYVIEAELNNLSTDHIIQISQTVNVNEAVPSKEVNNAHVYVSDSKGYRYDFISIGNGTYENKGFKPNTGETYNLSVQIEDNLYEATSTMPQYVEVDSIGFVTETIFGDDYILVVLNFQDPAGVPNYYKYNLSVNGQTHQFVMVSSDKYNDGLTVEHRLSNKDNDLATGDNINLIRSTIDYPVYKYWSEYQVTNLASASPSNPTSNISNGALGYFSVGNAKAYDLTIDNSILE